jgi:hypothetical protein
VGGFEIPLLLLELVEVVVVIVLVDDGFVLLKLVIVFVGGVFVEVVVV